MTSSASETAPAGGESFVFPLSFAQQRLWFLDRLEPGSTAYNIPIALRLGGLLDRRALEAALAGLTERHESLRTTFVEEGGEPSQVVHPVGAPLLEIEDLSAEADPAQAALDRARTEADRPFDLAEGPLIRHRLFRLAESEHLLVLTVHHIVADAWSLRVLRRELGELYSAQVEGRPPALSELEIQYGDFAVWQREWFQGDRAESQLAYWKKALEGAATLIELASDRPRPALQSDRGGHRRATLPPELAGRLEGLGSSEGATLFMTLLAGFGALLSRYSSQSDLVIGTPIANRTRLELEPVIGFFANTLPLRLDLAGDPSFRELLGRVRSTVLDASEHQDLPFEQLVAELNPERSLSHSPLFQVLFQLHATTGGGGSELPGLAVERVELDRGRSKFDLALTMLNGDDGLHASFEYSADLFDGETVARMLGHLETLLFAAVEHPDRPIAELPILTEPEREQLAAWNSTTHIYSDGDRRVHELVEAQVERTPDDTAAVFGASELTYRELNARANRLARRLRELGVGPDVPVAISIARSLELLVAVLAVLKAGGAYSPLDPTYPEERLRLMLEESAAPVVLTKRGTAELLPSSGAHIVFLDDEPEEVARLRSDNPSYAGSPDDLAYVLFTSGSTGRPKGVAMPHRPVTNLLLWQRDHIAPGALQTLQFASVSFDVAFQEIFSAWTSGGALVVLDEETRRDPAALLRLIDESAVERLFVPYVALQHLAESSSGTGLVPSRLRELITAGEALQASPAIRQLFQKLPGSVLHNHYGPTESHVVTAHVLSGDPKDWPARPPIGKPIANARIHILDPLGQELPPGIPGELHIGGPVLARGYLGRGELTAERFVPDRFSRDEADRLYRTGDLARYLPDGAIDFLGRMDNQVKVRGYRVELSEIESALLRHEQVRDAVAVVREDTPGEQRLVAYVVAEAPEPSPAELRDLLAYSLPEFMIPSAFVALEALPLGTTGKVDRKVLPTPDRAQTAVDEFVPPRDDTEQKLVEIWQELLGLSEPIGIRDDFFALGGHSLLAVKLISRVERELEVKLPLATLFEGATVERMAAHVQKLGRNTERWPTLVPLHSGGEKPPLFLLHGRNGELLYYRNLVRHMGADQPVYGVQPIGLDGREQPFWSVQEMAAHYVEELRAFAPDGPYLLAGYCFSGMLAYEVASQLERQGQSPALLALIDAGPYGLKRVRRAELERQKLADFRSRSLRGKASWVARRSRGLVYKIRTRTRFFLYDYFSRTGRTLPRPLRNMDGAILRALSGYATPESTLRLTLFRAAEDHNEALMRGTNWKRVTDRIEIRPILGEGIRHDNIMREPHVQALAGDLRACIERALAETAPSGSG